MTYMIARNPEADKALGGPNAALKKVCGIALLVDKLNINLQFHPIPIRVS